MEAASNIYPTIAVKSFRGETTQTVVLQTDRGRVVALDTAYDVVEANRDSDVAVNASYSGVLPARFISEHSPRAAIGADCRIGKDGAGVAGLWYFEALGIPAAAADVSTVVLGDGVDMYQTGIISVVNDLARRCGVRIGMPVSEAAKVLLTEDPAEAPAAEVTNRTVVEQGSGGRSIVCTDSIAFGLPEDTGRNVLCTAGHTGVPSVRYVRKVRPLGFISSDGGGAKNNSGIAGLYSPDIADVPGATVDALTARMGDGLSTYFDGVITACNDAARRLGVTPGQTATEAAHLMLANSP